MANGYDEFTDYPPELLQSVASMAPTRAKQMMLQRKMAEAQALRGAQVENPNILSALAALGQNIKGHYLGKRYDKEYGVNEESMANTRAEFLRQYGERMARERAARERALMQQNQPQQPQGQTLPFGFGSEYT